MIRDLRQALVDTDEKRFAYDYNPEFHGLIESLLITLPGLIESYATLGIAKDVDHKRKVEEAMNKGVASW